MLWLWKISDEWETQRAAGGGGRWVCIEYLAKTTCLMDLEIFAAMKRWNARSLDRSMLGCWPSGGWWRPPLEGLYDSLIWIAFQIEFCPSLSGKINKCSKLITIFLTHPRNSCTVEDCKLTRYCKSPISFINLLYGNLIIHLMCVYFT